MSHKEISFQFRIHCFLRSFFPHAQCISQIGSGAFGSVWKTRQIFDQQFYAIKLIRFRSQFFPLITRRMNPQGSETLKRARGEVATLSALHHKHIVGYNSAWIEQELGNTLIEELFPCFPQLTGRYEDSSMFPVSSSTSPYPPSPSPYPNPSSPSSNDSIDSFGVTNKYAISSETPSATPTPVPPDSILYNDYVHHTSSTSASGQNSSLYAMVPAEVQAFPRETSEHSSYCLYIQMEYCADGSLRDFLNRHDAPLSVRLDYFRQVEARGRRVIDSCFKG